MVVMGLFYTAVIGIAIGSLVECHGLNALTVQFCRNYSKPVVMLNSVFNVVTDFYVLLLPYPLILKLHLTMRRKIGVLAIFSGGLAWVHTVLDLWYQPSDRIKRACAASLARMIEFAIQYNNSDVLWIQAINAEATLVPLSLLKPPLQKSSLCLDQQWSLIPNTESWKWM